MCGSSGAVGVSLALGGQFCRCGGFCFGALLCFNLLAQRFLLLLLRALVLGDAGVHHQLEVVQRLADDLLQVAEQAGVVTDVDVVPGELGADVGGGLVGDDLAVGQRGVDRIVQAGQRAFVLHGACEVGLLQLQADRRDFHFQRGDVVSVFAAAFVQDGFLDLLFADLDQLFQFQALGAELSLDVIDRAHHLVDGGRLRQRGGLGQLQLVLSLAAALDDILCIGEVLVVPQISLDRGKELVGRALIRGEIAADDLALGLHDERGQLDYWRSLQLYGVVDLGVIGDIDVELLPAGADTVEPGGIRIYPGRYHVGLGAVGNREHPLLGAGDHQLLLNLRHVGVRHHAGAHAGGQLLVPLLVFPADVVADGQAVAGCTDAAQRAGDGVKALAQQRFGQRARQCFHLVTVIEDVLLYPVGEFLCQASCLHADQFGAGDLVRQAQHGGRLAGSIVLGAEGVPVVAALGKVVYFVVQVWIALHDVFPFVVFVGLVVFVCPRVDGQLLFFGKGGAGAQLGDQRIWGFLLLKDDLAPLWGFSFELLIGALR